MSSESPVIVIGAGRSGTNLLRDIICSLDGYSTWPCDEINYIWRHGNRNAPTDELAPADARPDVMRYVRSAFNKQQRRSGGAIVVEKTCANAVRVGFVDKIFPECRYVYIVRDGRDVVASAMERWTASLDPMYLARKARFVPPIDLPYYGLRYVRSRMVRFGSKEWQLSAWGPRFAGMNELVRTRSLAEVCAHQWMRCVEAAETQLGMYVEPSRVHRVHYEEIVAAPGRETERLASFLARPRPDQNRLPRIKASSAGRWRTSLSDQDRRVLGSLLGEALAARGYKA